ncbi:MAG: hypothetical protein IPJ40_13455 [Saprospirales bacterium]|nr:hypothetical protein [Saprospirales bacterium]
MTDGKTVVCATIDNRGKPSQAGLFSWDGDTLLPPVYFNIQAHPGGRFLVQTTDYQMGMTDEQGRFLIPLGPVRLSKMGNQPQDVILALEGSPLNGKVYDPNGRLLWIAALRATFLLEAGLAKLRTNTFTGILPLPGHKINRPFPPRRPAHFAHAIQRNQYASDDHPLIVHDGAAYLIMGWDGKPAIRAGSNAWNIPQIPASSTANRKTAIGGGFIHIGDPAGDRFTLQKIMLLPHSGYFAVKEEGRTTCTTLPAAGSTIRAYAFLEQPEREALHRLEGKMKSGRLVAYGASAQRGDDQPWVGFDEKAKAHDFPRSNPKRK